MSFSAFSDNNLVGDDGKNPSMKAYAIQVDGASIPLKAHGNCDLPGDCRDIEGVEGGIVTAHPHDSKVIELANGKVKAGGVTIMYLEKPTSATHIIVRNVKITGPYSYINKAWAWFGKGDVCPGQSTTDGYTCAKLMPASVLSKTL